MRVTRKVYTEEFRQDAVHLLKTTDRPFKKVAEDLGVSEFTLRQWYKQAVVPEHYRVHVEDKLARLERENAALQKENASLRMDREILKKAAAFFAKESE